MPSESDGKGRKAASTKPLLSDQESSPLVTLGKISVILSLSLSPDSAGSGIVKLFP